MTVIGVAGCTALLVTGFGLRDSFDTVSARQYGAVFTYDSLVMEKELKALDELNPKAAETPAEEEAAGPITIDDFAKVTMTVCKVLSCENVKKSDKLLKFKLDDGSGTERTILSGIAKYYKPEELVGKTIVACTNLAPRKMMGEMSQGMPRSSIISPVSTSFSRKAAMNSSAYTLTPYYDKSQSSGGRIRIIIAEEKKK